MKILNYLTKADIVFFLLPFLMINLIAGTLAQHSLGLYEAHKIYFASFIYFLGPLPLPGTYTLLALLALSLLLKFLFRSPWSWARSGSILAHLGVLVLVLGSGLSALTAREGFMIITEGERTPYIYDYNRRELFIFRDEVLQHRLPFEKLQGRISLANFPFILDVTQSCRNCAIERAQANPTARDMAQSMALQEKPLEKENETNLAGITFTLSGGNAGQNGIYIAFENMPRPITLTRGAYVYKIILGKEQRRLSFSIGLQKFTRDLYPGTMTAKNYTSFVSLEDENNIKDIEITMNKPLHYKGYAFYQSSFEETPEGNATILNVVQNAGKPVPYIASLLIGAGLLLQWLLYMRQKNHA